jgi:hypothetical protein
MNPILLISIIGTAIADGPAVGDNRAKTYENISSDNGNVQKMAELEKMMDGAKMADDELEKMVGQLREENDHLVKIDVL